MNILITGGAGFIGANFCHYIYNENDHFVCLDALTYAGKKEHLIDLLDKDNFDFVYGNICDIELVDQLFKKYNFDLVVNFAAESHVDNSVYNPQLFIDTNVTGVRVLLDACKKYNVNRFHQVSTDEVYGELNDDDPSFTENSPLKPTSPYSITKATADLLALSYHNIFGINVTISRCSNNYGIYQHTEKYIPKSINQLKHNQYITVHGDGSNTRDWIHTLDHCEGIVRIIKDGKPGEIYNIGSHCQKTNIEVAKSLLKCFGETEEKITFVANRKSNDRRYAINYEKISKELGYSPKYTFDTSISEIVDWYKNN
jgi:dTDP-glucose 4,6-dehydratase